jgi:hypothetical protein
MKTKFETKDSGERVKFASGMTRDTDNGKPRYDLIPLEPMRRLADLYARGTVKYGSRNWEQANTIDEIQRFRASAMRHMYQYLAGERDEDHMAAVVFNLFAAEQTDAKLLPFDDMYDALPSLRDEFASMGFLDEALAKVDRAAKKSNLRSEGEVPQTGLPYYEAIKG